uniref:Uncharacterized protein n=1 Tax=Panagrolaimus superbus TaxID=310955 RepID=A0A914YFS3_9BILA
MLIITYNLSEASDRIITEDKVCDEECLISKSNFHIKDKNRKVKPRSNSGTGTCSFQGIDTGASEEPFQLFDINNQQYDIASLTRFGGICDCSSNVKEAKHAVIKKELDGRIILTDAYILCGETENNEKILEELIFDYIKNVPERTLGSKPDLEKNDEYCLDERGFITAQLPGEIPCFSFISAFSNETYSSTNQLLEGNVNYYSGPYSVNRINQSEYVKHPSHPGKNISMIGLFYELGFTCNISKLNRESDNRCYSFFNSYIYSIICCCNKKPGQCSFRGYQDKSLFCGKGSFVMDLTRIVEMAPHVLVPNGTHVKELKRFAANKTFCSSQYVFDNVSIRYEMPAPSQAGLKDCNVGPKSEGSLGYCILNNDVCPSSRQNPPKTKITCCCREPNLCNVDFVAIHAVDRFEFMIRNKVCEQPMLYSVLFARTNYTASDDHKQPLCYIHYDVNQPTAKYFLPNNNIDLLRDIDYEAYKKEGCNVIAATIRPDFFAKCPDEKYKGDDTILPRPLLVCTCKGAKIDEETTKDTKFCDEELRNNIENKYNEIKDKLMPKCLGMLLLSLIAFID